MIKQLFYKWFGLEPDHCESCDTLRTLLAESNRERKDLLHKLLDRDKSDPPTVAASIEDFQPITPQYQPWRVRRQMMEAEDRQKSRLLADKAKEMDEAKKQQDPKIEALEQELGVK